MRMHVIPFGCNHPSCLGFFYAHILNVLHFHIYISLNFPHTEHVTVQPPVHILYICIQRVMGGWVVESCAVFAQIRNYSFKHIEYKEGYWQHIEIECLCVTSAFGKVCFSVWICDGIFAISYISNGGWWNLDNAPISQYYYRKYIYYSVDFLFLIFQHHLQSKNLIKK